MRSSKQRPAEWVSDSVPGRLALRLWGELCRIEEAAATEAQECQDDGVYPFVWISEAMKVLHEELAKEGRERPDALADYLPDYRFGSTWRLPKS